jgi:hypothetical protein
VLLDLIRADDGEALASRPTLTRTKGRMPVPRPRLVDDVTYGMPGSALPAMSTEELRGQ